MMAKCWKTCQSEREDEGEIHTEQEEKSKKKRARHTRWSTVRTNGGVRREQFFRSSSTRVWFFSFFSRPLFVAHGFLCSKLFGQPTSCTAYNKDATALNIREGRWQEFILQWGCDDDFDLFGPRYYRWRVSILDTVFYCYSRIRLLGGETDNKTTAYKSIWDNSIIIIPMIPIIIIEC